MKILFTGGDDNSNVGYQMSRAAIAAGHEVRGFQAVRHPWGYPDQFENKFDQSMIAWADVVHMYNAAQPTGAIPKDKPLVLQHGGEMLRRNPEVIEQYGQHTHRAHVCETADLLARLPDDAPQFFIVPPVSTRLAAFEPRKQGVVPAIGHFPSIGSLHKGTPFWQSGIDSLRGTFTWVCETREPIQWAAHLERVRRCDIILDQYSVDRPGFPDLGEPGVTTREAAALGIIPVVNSFYLHPYHTVYGDPCFLTVNSPEEIEVTLRGLLKTDRQSLANRFRARVWKNHSYENTGRLLQAVYDEVTND